MTQAPRHLVCGPLSEGESARSSLGLAFDVDGKPRPVVYVWIPENSVDDPEQFARLVRETELAARLFHPNVLQVFGLETVEGKLTRVVAFADGEPLRMILEAGGRIPQALAARILVDACAGVHFAHGKGDESGSLVHGALSLETLFVSYGGLTQVSGYGAYIAFGATPRRNKGAPLSPEQIRSGARAATRESDVYLLGQVLYECLAGESPFSCEHDPDKAALEKFPPALESFGAPGPLAAVVTRAMAQKPEDRYPNALALGEAIQAAAEKTAERHAVSAYVDILFPVDQGDRAARRKKLDEALQGLAKTASASAPAAAPAPPFGPAVREEPADDLILAENPPLPLSKPPAPEPSLPGQKPAAPVRAEDQYDLITTAEILLPLGPDGSPIVDLGAALDARVAAAGEQGGGQQSPPPPLREEAPLPAAPPSPAPPEPVVERPRRRLLAFVVGALVVMAGFALGYVASMFVGPNLAAALSWKALSPFVRDGSTPQPTPAPTPAPTPVPKPEAALVGSVTSDREPEPVEPATDRARSSRSPARKASPPQQATAKPAPTPRPKATAKQPGGTLTVRAPSQAKVSLDGKSIGTGTLNNVRVVEGRHRIVVLLGEAKIEDEFTVGAGETYTYDVTAVGAH